MLKNKGLQRVGKSGENQEPFRYWQDNLSPTQISLSPIGINPRYRSCQQVVHIGKADIHALQKANGGARISAKKRVIFCVKSAGGFYNMCMLGPNGPDRRENT